tara:strand:+ start:90 stop:368 length:279 start_codon:yes stop_codon:yes gene_type:complete
MSNIEVYAQIIAESVGRQSAEGINSSEHERFYDVAAAIVEPVYDADNLDLVESMEEYYDYMENNADNWASWIAQTYGSDWGRVAKIVAEEGY